MPKKPVIILFTVLVISFFVLAFFIVQHPVPKLDHQISLLIQKNHSNFLDNLMLGISFFGELPYSLLMVLAVALVFFKLGFRRESYFIVAILLSGLVILLFKNLFDRPRPTQFYVRLVEINRFQSFPSGHVMSYILFFGFLIVLMQSMKHIPNWVKNVVTWISAFYMLTISYSRIYLGAHWFTDTLGGFLLGLICLIILCFFYFKKKRG